MIFNILLKNLEGKCLIPNIGINELESFSFFLNMFDFHGKDDIINSNEIEIIIPDNILNIKKEISISYIGDTLGTIFEYSHLIRNIWNMDDKLLKDILGYNDKQSCLTSLPYGKELYKMYESCEIVEFKKIAEIEEKRYSNLYSIECIDNLFIDIILVDYFNNEYLLDRLLRFLNLYGIKKDEEFE